MINLLRREPKPSRRTLIWQFYRPSTESVRQYEEEDRNRARLAAYLSTNQSRKKNDRLKHIAGR